MTIPQGLQRLHGEGHYGDERKRGRVLRQPEGWVAITPTGTRLPPEGTLMAAYAALLRRWDRDHPAPTTRSLSH